MQRTGILDDILVIYNYLPVKSIMQQAEEGILFRILISDQQLSQHYRKLSALRDTFCRTGLPP